MPATITKNGPWHTRQERVSVPSTSDHPQGFTHYGAGDDSQDVMVVGAACSECFSGKRLADVLRPGMELERRALELLSQDKPAPALAIHTSSGVPSTMDGFIGEFQHHLPWRGASLGDDWFMSFQLEGASAVLAACDLLIQMQVARGHAGRNKVAVGRRSYHGPGSTSVGSAVPLWPKPHQIMYPVPTPDAQRSEETTAAFHTRLLAEFSIFLDEHADELGVMLVEPQWGSSVCALPWPQDLLRAYIRMAQDRGVLVCADEIMCGLGRHGKGTTFLSEAWDLQPDAVTFGKAIAGGVTPLSGVALRAGGNELNKGGSKVLQMHTYAGSSASTFMAATGVLQTLPQWHGHLAAMDGQCREAFGAIHERSNGFITINGHGLMWGGVFPWWTSAVEGARAAALFKEQCAKEQVLPYNVPVGFMVTPVYDVTAAHVDDMAARLASAAEVTAREMGWLERDAVTELRGWRAANEESKASEEGDDRRRRASSRARRGGSGSMASSGSSETSSSSSSPSSPRYKGPVLEEMDAAQRAIHDEIAGTRTTGIRGPFGPWLANPDIASPAQALGRVCRYETSLALRESELAILLVAQHLNCPTEWAIHVHEARGAGLPEAAIRAIEGGAGEAVGAALETEREGAIWRFAAELVEGTRVSDETYAAAVEALGERGVVELTSVIGYYTYVAMTLNVFEVEP